MNEADGKSGERRARYCDLQCRGAADARRRRQQWPAATGAAEEAMIAVRSAAVIVMLSEVQEQSCGESLRANFERQGPVVRRHETRGNQRAQQQRRQQQRR